MKIAIPDDYQDAVRHLECFKLLEGHEVTVYHDAVKDTGLLAERLKDADVLVLIRERTAIDAALLDRLPSLKLISQTGKVSNHIDVAACSAHKVAIAEGRGSPIAPAELTWNLIMNAQRQVPAAIAAMQQGQWQTNIGRVLHGSTLGIWGYGKIGKMVAGYAKAFGMKVMVWGSSASRTLAVQDGFEAAPGKEAFFSGADIVTLHLRLVPATKHIVTMQDLGLMKTDAILVNTSRAELVEEGALLQALKLGRPGFAALDVYEDEPVYDPDHALLKMPNVICTPHLGYVEQNGYELYFGDAFRNIIAFAEGSRDHILNKDAL